MVTGDPVYLNLTMSPSSRKLPALLAKNSAQPCQTESYGEIMQIRVRPTDDDDDDILIWLLCLLVPIMRTGVGEGKSAAEESREGFVCQGSGSQYLYCSVSLVTTDHPIWTSVPARD